MWQDREEFVQQSQGSMPGPRIARAREDHLQKRQTWHPVFGQYIFRPVLAKIGQEPLGRLPRKEKKQWG